MTQKWVCTDPDTKQYGTRINDNVYQFKQPNINNGEIVEIDLGKYSRNQMESCINSYGYTMRKYPTNRLLNDVYTLYEKDADWIIAECLFEMEEKSTI